MGHVNATSVSEHRASRRIARRWGHTTVAIAGLTVALSGACQRESPPDSARTGAGRDTSSRPANRVVALEPTAAVPATWLARETTGATEWFLMPYVADDVPMHLFVSGPGRDRATPKVPHLCPDTSQEWRAVRGASLAFDRARWRSERLIAHYCREPAGSPSDAQSFATDSGWVRRAGRDTLAFLSVTGVRLGWGVLRGDTLWIAAGVASREPELYLRKHEQGNLP